MGFEKAAFKLTQEMIDVMGQGDLEQYMYFKQLISRAYLAARQSMDAVVTLVHALSDSGLDCYTFVDTLSKVRK